jgi:hypothetical protein
MPEIFSKYVVYDADFKIYNRFDQLLRNDSVKGQIVWIKKFKRNAEYVKKSFFFESLPKWVFRYTELKFINCFPRLLSYRLVTEVTPF